jgi:mono/diheme cytochrome c family protein
MKTLAPVLVSLSVFAVLSASADVDFKKDIAPILEKSCVECHGPNKQKADLRLDTKDAAMKGSKGGPVIVAKDPEKSEIYKRIILPKGNDDVMPPKGEPLSKAQTDLIKQWIAAGAIWPDGEVIKSAETAAATGSGETQAKLPDYKPGAAETKAIGVLEAAGVSIRPIAQNMNWREASFRPLGSIATDAAVAPIKDVLGLLDLNLAGTKITDAGLAAVKGLTNLTMLHLEHTQISDAGMAHLKDLKNLEYLNLFDTQVTDAGLKNLENLTKLKNVYLWQSKVTDAGIKSLQEKLPSAKIHNGWVATEVAKKEEKPAEKK